MSDPAHLLLVGNDGRLLNERAVLLLNFWQVSAISSFDASEPSLHKADLLVLCHTLTEPQRQTWIAGSRGSLPVRPIVSLEFADPVDTGRRTGSDATVDHARGPAALVSTIYELLNERGKPSKHWISGGQTLLGEDGLPATAV